MATTDIENLITTIEENDGLRDRLLNALFAEMYLYAEFRDGKRWVVAEVNYETYPLTEWKEGWESNIFYPLSVPTYAERQITMWLENPKTIAGINNDATSETEMSYPGNPT